MKKYITIAALLAAGSAFANAVSLEDATISKGGNTGYDTQSGNFTVALTFDVEELCTLLEKGNAPAWGTDIIKYICNGTATGVTVNGGSSSGAINTSGLFARWGDGTAWNNVQWQGDFNLSDVNGDKTGTGWDSVAKAGLVYSFGATSGTAVSFTLLDNDENIIVNSYVLAGGLKSQNAGAAALTFDDSVVASYYFNEYIGGNETNMKNLSYAAAIPEPSTFGLLAGLGALALVGTRRRRK